MKFPSTEYQTFLYKKECILLKEFVEFFEEHLRLKLRQVTNTEAAIGEKLRSFQPGFSPYCNNIEKVKSVTVSSTALLDF